MKKYLRYIIIASVLLILIATYLLIKVIKVKTVNCESQYGPCSESVNAEIDKFQGNNIPTAISNIKKTLGKDKKVSQYSVRFVIPSSIKVYVVEKKGEAVLGKQGLDKFTVLDKSGEVIEIVKNTSLPIINISTSDSIEYGLGSKVPENLVFALQIIRLMFSSYGVKLISLYNDRIETKLTNGIKVIFPLEGETDILMGSLNLILSRLNNQAGEIRIGEIDLRYKNPVIR